uniref:Acetylglutamate kinase n=1 Tax=Steinernema glaseri TaxID=37863 RepID=A0A1I7Y6T8_9BILA
MGRKEKKDFRDVAAGIAYFRSLAEAHGVTLTLNGGSLL